MANNTTTSTLLAGTASITVAGTTYLLEGSFKYSPSTVKREALVGMDGFHGWKETPVPGSISASLRDTGDLTVADFNATIAHALGLPVNKDFYSKSGRPFKVAHDGKPLLKLFS